MNWNKEKDDETDESNQIFIFSLNLNKKYDMISKSKKAINNSQGPCFGDCDFILQDDMKVGLSYANKSCNFLSNNNLELTGGKDEHERFETDELEVYKVIY